MGIAENGKLEDNAVVLKRKRLKAELTIIIIIKGKNPPMPGLPEMGVRNAQVSEIDIYRIQFDVDVG